MSDVKAEVFPEILYDISAEEMSREWYFKVQKYLGGGYTAVSEGGPFTTEDEAVLECAWVKNRMETYGD